MISVSTESSGTYRGEKKAHASRFCSAFGHSASHVEALWI